MKRQKSFKKTIELVKTGLSALEFVPGESFFQSLQSYLEQLERFSKAYNITGFRDCHSLAERGIIDSLLYLEFIPEGSRTLLDVGSGAGLPGLIIKMARPELEVTLIEPSRKKAAFLDFVSNKLNLKNTHLFQTSVEQHASTKQQYDVITTRALFKADEMLRKVSPFLKTNSRVILSKGPKAIEEVSGLKDHRDLKIELHRRKLPFSGIERYFLVIEKQ
ncbi:MAG: 16S rRNA (guanine(527)-N(7))-methyltransferase RsmG [Nitrospirae bacterium]|nr:MAG: 16S rRNA (guanine(527)-N(7))-methyltransferase RsmG [Nitrospirota bacterium]